jgi:hypothetical protein
MAFFSILLLLVVVLVRTRSHIGLALVNAAIGR